MMSRHVDPPTDESGDVPAESKHSQALEPATVEQFQSEMDDFVMHTRRRLNSLSQSLTKYLARDPETKTQSVSHASVRASEEETIHVIADQEVTDPVDALMTEMETPTPAMAALSIDLPVQKIASTDQFSAIKLRLAQQLKNSS